MQITIDDYDDAATLSALSKFFANMATIRANKDDAERPVTYAGARTYPTPEGDALRTHVAAGTFESEVLPDPAVVFGQSASWTASVTGALDSVTLANGDMINVRTVGTGSTNIPPTTPVMPPIVVEKPKRKRRTKAELRAAAEAATAPTPAIPPPPAAPIVPPPPPSAPAVVAPVGDFRTLMGKIVRSKLPTERVAEIVVAAGAPNLQTLAAMPHLFAAVDKAVDDAAR